MQQLVWPATVADLMHSLHSLLALDQVSAANILTLFRYIGTSTWSLCYSRMDQHRFGMFMDFKGCSENTYFLLMMPCFLVVVDTRRQVNLCHCDWQVPGPQCIALQIS